MKFDASQMPQMLIISGPSGSGKSTLIRMMREDKDFQHCSFAVSVTCRTPRPGEQQAEAYKFVTPDEFHARKTRGDFAESNDVYGTTWAELERLRQMNYPVAVFDLDLIGGVQLKKFFPGAVILFVLPPTYYTLENRLKARGTEGDQEVERRLQIGKAMVEEAWTDLNAVDYFIVAESRAEMLWQAKQVVNALSFTRSSSYIQNTVERYLREYKTAHEHS